MSDLIDPIFGEIFCRACLTVPSDSTLYGFGHISRFYEEFLEIPVRSRFPYIVCVTCAHMIMKFLRFCDGVAKAHSLLEYAATKTKTAVLGRAKIKKMRGKVADSFSGLSTHRVPSPIYFQEDTQAFEADCVQSEVIPKCEEDEASWLEDVTPVTDTVAKEQILNVSDKITVTLLTREEAVEEQNQLSTDALYLNSLYKCEICYKGLATLETFNTHMESHSKKFGQHECDICHKYFKTITSCRLHRCNHMKRYSCNVCGQRGVSREGLLRHYSIAHEQNHCLPCDQCERVFKNSYLLQHHIRYTHKEKERCTCRHCGKTFANKCSLRQHCIRKHSEDLPEGARRHICDICGHKFMDVTNLREHMAKHSSLREFYCADCDASFKTKLALQTHLKYTLKHADPDKIILCQHCPLKFADSRLLSRHVRDNHRASMFKCDLCPKEYSGRAQLRTHNRFAHEGHTLKKKYVCDICGRAFAYKPVMMDHMNTHTGCRPHKCTECPSDFGNAAALYRHKKLVHRKDKNKGKNTD